MKTENSNSLTVHIKFRICISYKAHSMYVHTFFEIHNNKYVTMFKCTGFIHSKVSLYLYP